jgi:hypothetical protein
MASAHMLENLAKLTGSAAVTVENEAYEDDPGNPSVVIVFSEGTRLRADYWRLIKNRRALISSFDHHSPKDKGENNRGNPVRA